MLVATLEKENKKYYIYVKKELNNYSYYGYVEDNNVRKKLSVTDVEFFKDYILNYENINLSNDYKLNVTDNKKLISKLKKSNNLFNQLLNKKYSGLSLVTFQILLTLAITLGYLGITNNLSNKINELNENISKEQDYILKDVYAGKLDSNKIKEIINNSTNLNQEEKKYLINETFFEFIDDYICEPVVYSRLQDLDIIDFTEEEKNNQEYDSFSGFYTEKQPNILHVRNYTEKDTLETHHTNSHEHIHQYQGDYRYSYLVEATCALLNAEFYTSYNQTYIEEQKRLKVLMEIIGTEPVLKYVAGSFEEIENILINNLTNKQVEILKDCFKISSSIDNIDEVHSKIDELLAILYYNIYGEKIENNEIINAIYNDMIYTRNYFNITNDTDMIYEIIPNQEVYMKDIFDYNDQNNIYEYSLCEPMIGNKYYTVFNPIESKILTNNEYETLRLIKPNIDEYITEEYQSDYQYIVKPDGTVIIAYDKDKNINLSKEEAIEQGYLEVKRYYNGEVKKDIRIYNTDIIYNKVIFKDNYYYVNYSDECFIPVARLKEVPTVNNKITGTKLLKKID